MGEDTAHYPPIEARIASRVPREQEKKVEVQLMSFYHINVETIEKLKNSVFFFKSEKMYISPANDGSLIQVHKQ